MTRPFRRLLLVPAILLACTPDEPQDAPRLARPVEGVPAAPAAPAAPVEHSALEPSAMSVLAFLRGTGPFPASALADSVRLYAGPEAGGAATTLPRDRLRERAAWRVPINGHTTAVVPPPEFSQVSVKPGTYYRCFEYELASRFPQLAAYPHVGIRLQPSGADSCLQSWNVTLVFDSAGARPLIALIFDQWEW